MTPEGKVKKSVQDVLKRYGAYFFTPATGGYGTSGLPDIVACYKGRFLGIECKAGKNRTSAMQEHQLNSITKAGGAALVVYENNIQDVVRILDGWNH